MAEQHNLISAEDLAAVLCDPNLVVVEAGFALPGMMDSLVQQQNHYIPNARFFDIESISDRNNSLPHMVPNAVDFAQAVGAMGIGNKTQVVCYDRYGLFSAGRVWWMFRLFGHQNVMILNGGMKRWVQLNLPLQLGRTVDVVPVSYQAEFDSSLYATKDDVLSAIDMPQASIVDARPASRFAGSDAEPRAGMRAGHMPSALNVCYQDLVNPQTGELRPLAELRQLYRDVPIDHTITYSCGSGITAAALLFAGESIGYTGRVYDGSWAEWGSLADTPIERD